MKVLYATQSTGNGHLIRAREFIPIIKEKVDLDILISGSQGQIELGHPVNFRKYGLSFLSSGKGGISVYRTIRSFKPIRLLWDILTLPVKDYDLVINDFEPISAWACSLRKVPCVSLSHQSAFRSSLTPRPVRKNLIQELILLFYAPTRSYEAFHFESYDQHINTPVISTDIRDLQCEEHNEICVYLPAFRSEVLAKHFKALKSYKWRIFSPYIEESYSDKNLEFYPVERALWINAFKRSKALIIGAGFEGPAEVLYHGKKLMVIPMRNQYEQMCNAEALKRLGVNVQYDISDNFSELLENWLTEDTAIQIKYPDISEALIDRILKQ